MSAEEERPKPGLEKGVLEMVNKARVARGVEPLVRGPGFRDSYVDKETGDVYDGPKGGSGAAT